MIEEYARRLVADCEGQRHPYNYARWLSQNIGWHYGGDRATEVYFAAINLMKAAGVENKKNKPLSKLNKKQRQQMRTIAKRFASSMATCCGLTVFVTKSPIKTYDDGQTLIQIAVETSESSRSFMYASFEKLLEWNELSDQSKMTIAYRNAQPFKSKDHRIADNIEVIKANLEALLP